MVFTVKIGYISENYQNIEGVTTTIRDYLSEMNLPVNHLGHRNNTIHLITTLPDHLDREEIFANLATAITEVAPDLQPLFVVAYPPRPHPQSGLTLRQRQFLHRHLPPEM